MSEVSGVSKISSSVSVEVSGGSDKYPFNSKTFWVAVVCIALGIYFIASGDKETGIQLILLGLGLLGVRDAVRKIGKRM